MIQNFFIFCCEKWRWENCAQNICLYLIDGLTQDSMWSQENGKDTKPEKCYCADIQSQHNWLPVPSWLIYQNLSMCVTKAFTLFYPNKETEMLSSFLNVVKKYLLNAKKLVNNVLFVNLSQTSNTIWKQWIGLFCTENKIEKFLSETSRMFCSDCFPQKSVRLLKSMTMSERKTILRSCKTILIKTLEKLSWGLWICFTFGQSKNKMI